MMVTSFRDETPPGCGTRPAAGRRLPRQVPLLEADRKAPADRPAGAVGSPTDACVADGMIGLAPASSAEGLPETGGGGVGLAPGVIEVAPEKVAPDDRPVNDAGDPANAAEGKPVDGGRPGRDTFR